MDFFLFLLVNLTLFVRPSELVPGWETLPIYNIVIVAALLAALPKVLNRLDPNRLSGDPITFCVFGVLVAIPISHLAHFDTGHAWNEGYDFFKVVIYYLVLISVVDSTRRLRVFLYSIALFTTIASTVAILHYFDYISVPSLKVLEEGIHIDQDTGERISIRRMQATGLFGDPNDLAMIVVFSLMAALAALGDRTLRGSRFLWGIPIGLLLLTLGLTKSRGGVLALGTALAVLSYVRWGATKTVLVLALFLPVAGVLAAGRDSGMLRGTGQTRMELWASGLVALKQSPVFGTGSNTYREIAGQVAHNSFVQSFTELGFFGGALYLGGFWFAAISLWKLGVRLRNEYRHLVDPSFIRLNPYVLAALCGSCAAMMSLSRTFIVPTYMVLGAANAYVLGAQQEGLPNECRLTPRSLAQLLPLSAVFLLVTHIFIRVVAF